MESGFHTLICEEDLKNEEHLPDQQSNRQQVKVSMFTMSSGRCSRLAVLILTLLAAVLLIVDISMGVHYNNLKDTHLTLDDTESIAKELAKLQEDYKNAVETMKVAQKQKDSETNSQTETNWELEHQTKRSEINKEQIDKITKDIAKMSSHLLMLSDGCRHCPPGWFLMNSVCYYFSFSNKVGLKSWQKARQFCQMQGGDLLVIDSKDKENMTVNYLMTHQDSKPDEGFWFGLRDSEEEGTWKWLDGRVLVEGYWGDGEPNDHHRNEDCAAVYPVRNFFKAWNDVRCDISRNWICEKAPTSMA
ncbi:uncharacterized protein PAE49_018726 [Odontesthes bonariensis]|uniref:uncharacterized protein LOC142365957 n=1 Tax=Odontesthes bonariensis TaxID=219752 RepID=UPI003F590137